MSKSRKILIGILVVLTIILAGVSGYIALNLDNADDSSGGDVSVSGYGDAATKDLYIPFERVLKNWECENVFRSKQIGSHSIVSSSNLNASGIEFPVVNCGYELSDGTEFDLKLYTYTLESTIANSEADHYLTRNFGIDVIDEYQSNRLTGFFGVVNSSTERYCMANAFHSENEFDYIEVRFNSTSDCDLVLPIYKDVLSQVSSFVETALIVSGSLNRSNLQ